MNFAQLLHKAARSAGEQPALALGTRVVMSYAAFSNRVACLAAGLHAQGLRAGDRLAIGMKNTPELMVVLFAAWHAGLIAVPMNAKLHRREFAYILDSAGARLCVITLDMAESISGLEEEIPTLDKGVIAVDSPQYAALLAHEPIVTADVAPDDVAWLFYTSGTTGRPKGAMLTHRNLEAATMNYYADIDTIGAGDCIIHAAPMTHGSGFYGLPHVAKGALQVVPQSGGYDVAETITLIRHHPGATFFFAPTMLVRLLASPGIEAADLTNLKTICYGGGPMYVEHLVNALAVLGNKLVQIYGQGESPMTITGLAREVHMERDHPRYLARLASVGVARTDIEVKVFDIDDNELPTGEIGEVVVRGDTVMKGYWRDSEATAKTLKGGWLHTGDIGSMDEDGFLTLMGRSKDMIISGGSNIYPREIEEVLLRHPDVLEAAVVGRPHPEWGEEVVAFTVPREEARLEIAALDQLCLDNIARFKRPKAYRVIDALPKNNYGKILKTELRKRLADEKAETLQNA